MALQGDNMMKVKKSNRGAILKLLHEQGNMSRKRIANMLALTPATITTIVGNMIKEGLLEEKGELPSNGSTGRREIMVGINASARYALGIAISIGIAYVSAVDLAGNLIFSEQVSIDSTRPSPEIVDILSKELMRLLTVNGIQRKRTVGLGITVRGVVDREKCRSLYSFDALSERDVPLKEMFEKATGFPVVLDNNVRSLFEAHMFMSRTQLYSSQFFVRCEYGIGAAISINHRIWNGSKGKCAELGHTPVVTRSGKLCRCGKRGCLETIASPMAIQEDVRAIYSKEETPILYQLAGGAAADQFDIGTIIEAARLGDAKTAEILDHALTLLCNTLKTVIYTVDPDKVILYGRMFEDSYCLMKVLSNLKTGFSSKDEPIVEKSEFNLLLEDRAAGIMVVDDFFENGGIPQLSDEERRREVI